MVRDYKHIRRPELDDSDGGYSDYQSENEDDSAAPPDLAPVDLLPGKPSCMTNDSTYPNILVLYFDCNQYAQ